MAGPGKSSSRWGSFISQAVAGVEARLDTILADEELSQQKEQPLSPRVSAAASPSKPSPGPSRAASTNRANDRLQERLARAIAAKAAGQKLELTAAKSSPSAQTSPRHSLDTPARTSSETTMAERSGLNASDTASPRELRDTPGKSEDANLRSPEQATNVVEKQSLPVVMADRASLQNCVLDTASNRLGDIQARIETIPGGNGEGGESREGEDERGNEGKEKEEEEKRGDEEREIERSVKEEEGKNEQEEEDEEVSQGKSPSGTRGPSEGSTGTEERIRELEKALEEAQLQHQEQIHGYVERIDALEVKLQYLARETTETARKSALAAPTGSVEKKLAEKDEQIAQLMEEGKNLASTEQKHRAIIKQLRAKMAQDEKELAVWKASGEKADKELQQLRKRARRADDLSKARDDLAMKLEHSQRELGALRLDIGSKDDAIAELKVQLQLSGEQAQIMAAKANDRPRDQDRRRITELEETVAALQVEKSLVADRAKMQANDLREEVQRANERSRALELEMKAEVQMMESKLEVMRIRAEEASTGVTGDSQAKLLRQVETLQTQYSIASENWQGIEATLLARISNLERERDEALQRETEMRKKAREASLRAKRNEEELEEARTRLPGLQELKFYQEQLTSLRKRAEEAEAAMADARADLERQMEALAEEKEEKQQDRETKLSRPSSRTPTERQGWFEDLPGAPFRNETFRSDSRPETPLLPAAPQRTMSSDTLGLQSLATKFRKASAPSSNSDAGAAGSGSFSRRPSALPPGRPSVPASFSILPLSPATPSASQHPLDREREEALESLETSSSPQQVLQDMVSVSTVAAGPSVQLVERMSAAIRRLQSEKMAAREELARMAKQRDEARAEIVALMRQVEAGGAAARRVASLEAEVAEVNARYETTLELLGEKSELVEELRADVQDVKAMYRDLVERTVK